MVTYVSVTELFTGIEYREDVRCSVKPHLSH